MIKGQESGIRVHSLNMMQSLHTVPRRDSEREEEETSKPLGRPPSYRKINFKDPEDLGGVICFGFLCLILVFLFGFVVYAAIRGIVELAMGTPTKTDWTRVILSNISDGNNQTTVAWGNMIHFLLGTLNATRDATLGS